MEDDVCPRFEGCRTWETFVKYLEDARMRATLKSEKKREFEKMFCHGDYEGCPAYEE